MCVGMGAVGCGAELGRVVRARSEGRRGASHRVGRCGGGHVGGREGSVRRKLGRRLGQSREGEEEKGRASS